MISVIGEKKENVNIYLTFTAKPRGSTEWERFDEFYVQ